MKFTIQEESLTVLNEPSRVDAYAKYLKNVLRNKTNMILVLTKQDGCYEANFYENNIPASYFGPIMFTSSDAVPVGETSYIELPPKALALLVPTTVETSFEMKPTCMVIKQGPLTIKDSYESTDEEVKNKLDSYAELFDLEDGDSLELTKEHPLALHLAILATNPDAYLDILEGKATYSQGTFAHIFPVDVEKNFYINCYLASKIVNMLAYCEKVVFVKNPTNITIKGFVTSQDVDPIVENISPTYDREDEPFTDEELAAWTPGLSPDYISEEVTVSFEELISTFDIAKTKIRSFLDKDANLCTFTKNGQGATFKLSTGDEQIGMTDIAINIGSVDTDEPSEDSFVDYKINIPLQYLKNTQLGASTVKLIHDNAELTCVEVVLDNRRPGEIMLIGKE